MTTILELAGVVDGMPEDEYHAHDALSASGAKKLIAPSCPAIYRWEKDNGQPPKRAFDVGHAAHAQVLGVGGEVVVVQKTAKDKTVCDAEDYTTVSARQHRDEIRAAGKIPLLASEKAAVDGMAAALRQHPKASALFDPDHGKPEQSLFWRDWVTGVQRRARLDWLPESDGGRLVIADYKTCVSAEPSAVRKTIANYAYHQQDAWYRDGVHTLGLADDIGFRFVFQEKTAPYLVTVVELDNEAVRVGRARNDEALRVFAKCTATGVWPSYSDDVQVVSLPPWANPREEWI